MIFEKINLYLEDENTGKLKITFICDSCKKEMDKPYYSFFRVYSFENKNPGYSFYCKKCKEKLIL